MTLSDALGRCPSYYPFPDDGLFRLTHYCSGKYYL